MQIDAGRLSGKKLFVATPMYGGMCNGNYVLSLLNLSNETREHGIGTHYDFLFNESLVQRGRNMLCSEFMESGATHMMFIDADIGFDAKDVVALLALCGTDEYEIIGGTYPKKTVSWDKIARAARAGMADGNPRDLSRYMGDFVLNFAEGTTSFKMGEPVEVQELGTGFMMFHRRVLEKHMKAFPEDSYTPDNTGTRTTRKVHRFFDCAIDPESNRYLSEDYWFCHRSRGIGIKVWMCPWMNLDHYGTFKFVGDLGAFANMREAERHAA